MMIFHSTDSRQVPPSVGRSECGVDPLDLLPETPLGESGTICRRFRDLGLMTFRAACRWVRDVPYGSNRASRHPEVVFEEMRGTCQSKHSLIATLAQELDLSVSKYVGAYRLDDSMVEGVGAVLAAHGLTYVPQTHCVLKYDERFFDLTAGNCHGKKRDVTDMDAYFRVNPFASEAEEHAIYELCVRYYQHSDPILALRSIAEIRRIAGECRMKLPMACSAP